VKNAAPLAPLCRHTIRGGRHKIVAKHNLIESVRRVAHRL
jgi:hypothetical protein